MVQHAANGINRNSVLRHPASLSTQQILNSNHHNANTMGTESETSVDQQCTDPVFEERKPKIDCWPAAFDREQRKRMRKRQNE